VTPLASRIANLLVPLSDFYAETGTATPAVSEIDGREMPRPYRDLLVHDNDMTPTLERHFGQRIHLRLLDMEIDDGVLTRQVVLVTDQSERSVEFGAIRIFLDRFDDPEARRLVREARVPLGTILHDFEVPHQSHPTGYFAVRCDDTIGKAMGLSDRPTLYGRHNILHAADGSPIAEVVEILPPLSSEQAIDEP
jgi:hypothetical protein